MAIEQMDRLRRFLTIGKYREKCDVKGCMNPPVESTYLCERHLLKANEYFSAQLGLDPLYHMKHDVSLNYGNAWTYFVGSREHRMVKIGVTTRLKSRMSSLRNSSPVSVKLFAVVFGPPCIEDALHRRFEKSRMHGEWFKITSDIEDCIEAIKNQEFGKYIPEGMYYTSIEARAQHLAERIKHGSSPNSARDRTPVMDFLNGY